MTNLRTVDLLERIALCEDFSLEERTLILDALSLVVVHEGHVYPFVDIGRDSDWLPAKMAWKILDRLPPGTLKDVHRCFLAGMISGALARLIEPVH